MCLPQSICHTRNDRASLLERSIAVKLFQGQQLITNNMEVESNSTALKFKEQGNAAYKSHDYNKAINCYNKTIKENPSDPSFYSNRALCYFNMGKLHEALEDCQRSLSIQPNSGKVLRKKCQICLQLLRFQEAENAAKALVSFERSQNANNQLEQIESLRSNYERMMKAEQSGDYQQALSCSTHLVNKIQGNDKLRMHKAEALLKTGQINQAASIVNCFSHASPQISYLHGLVALYSGDSEKARRCFSEGLRIDPHNSKCRESLNRAKRCETCKEQGNELAKKNQWKEAVSRYTQAITLDPYNKKLNSVIYSNRGLAYSKLGQSIKALEDLNKSLELEPNYVKSLLRRADINMHREDYSTALNDYVKAQQLDPSANLKHKIQEARKKEKAAKKKDYYAILGVSKGATEAQIKKAYKTLALKYHPDRNRAKSEVQQQEAAKKFKDIAEAHTVLTDPEKRKRYDCGDIEYDGDQGGTNFGGGDFGSNGKFNFNGQNMSGMGVDPTQIFQMFFSGAGNEGFQGFQGFKSFGGREKRAGSRSKGFPGFGGARGFQNFGFS